MSAIFTIYCIASTVSGTVGAPLQDWQPPWDNVTAMDLERAPAWVSGPRTRGSFEIIYSCTFTLALCVYTAVHLNVPPSDSKFSHILRKTKWALIALIAPELVLYTAWHQWYQAREFCKAFNMIQKAADAPSEWDVFGPLKGGTDITVN
jgi:hypothetical protein